MRVIKAHTDVMTVASELRKMQEEYIENGFNCEVSANVLKLNFSDGYAITFWQDGAFYEKCYKYNSDGEPIEI